MPVTTKYKNSVLTAIINGDIDHHTAPSIRESIDDAIIVNEKAEKIVLDFSGVTFMDSSGVGLVMGRYRLLHPMGRELSVINLSERDYKIFKMSGLEKIAELNVRAEGRKELSYEKNK